MKLIPNFTLAVAYLQLTAASDNKKHAADRPRGPNNGLFDTINKIGKKILAKNPTRGGPGLRSISKNDLSALHQYGCWCHFGELSGKGQPVDEWDKECKSLQDGYECIHLDSDGECNVFQTDYNSSIGIGDTTQMTVERLKHECETANGVDTCASRICLVEGAFIQNLISMAFNQGLRPNFMKYSHRSPMFDPEIVCSVGAGNGPSERSCCGDYPSRFPYKTYGGDRQCCQGRTYNTWRHECCEDGSLRVFCQA